MLLLRPLLLLASAWLFSLCHAEQIILDAHSESDSASLSLPSSSWTVSGITRSLELGGAVSRGSTVYSINRNGDDDGSDDSTFVFSIDADIVNAGQLSWLEASVGKTSNNRKAATVKGLGYNAARNAHFYAIDMSPVKHSNEETVTISQAYIHHSVPKPATLSQDAANQGMYWQGDLLGGAAAALSNEIPADKIKVRVKTPSPRAVEEIVAPGWSASHAAGASTFIFTNTESVSPSSPASAVASVYYEQPDPVISIRKLERTAQISHWGYTLAVQDNIELVNDGPTLKGHFSRLTHQAISHMRRSGNSVSPHTLTSLSMVLPPNIHSPYFIDEVGNVSTSRFRPSPKRPQHTTNLQNPKKPIGTSLLELIPRYPLLGGWNYTFSVGYQQPLEDVLRHDKKQGRYLLAVPFLTPLKNIAVDEVTFRIVLPEGASNIQLSPPFPLDDLWNSTTYSYLDTSGRPTLILSKRGCSEKHGLEVLVSYDYSTAKLMRKPLAVAGVLGGCFTLAGVLRRLSWSIKG